MIIIASYNNLTFLERLLQNLLAIDLCGQKIIIVDSIDLGIATKYPAFTFEIKNTTDYDTGSYLYAIKKYPNENFYILLHDSVEVIRIDFVKSITMRLKKSPVVAFWGFRYFYDTPEQKQWVESDLNVSTLPEKLIFGPTFAITNTALRTLPKPWLQKLPSKKIEACGMERRWSLMFHILKIPVDFVDELEVRKIRTGTYLRKYRGNRE